MDPNQPIQSYDTAPPGYSSRKAFLTIVIGLIILVGISYGGWALWRHYHKKTGCQTTTTYSCKPVVQPVKTPATKQPAVVKTSPQNNKIPNTTSSPAQSTPTPPTPSNTTQSRLSNTGPGNILLLFFGVSLLGYVIHIAYSYKKI